jgi:hypothetical protein
MNGIKNVRNNLEEIHNSIVFIYGNFLVAGILTLISINIIVEIQCSVVKTVVSRFVRNP